MSHTSEEPASQSSSSDINESPPWTPQALPDTLRADGRPVWEPPILDYSDLIGEIYEQKREAVLDLTGGNVAKTTSLMDIYTEENLLWEYYDWVKNNTKLANGTETEHFFRGLRKEVWKDWSDVEDEWLASGGIRFIIRIEDGSYQAFAEHSQGQSDVCDDSASDTLGISSINGQECSSGDHQDEASHERHGVSSPADEAEELAWLASLDVSASETATTATPLRTAQLVKPTSLALRLISLRTEPSTVEGEHLPTERWIDDID